MENKIKNSETYLKSVLGKENGFSVPKNYFEDLDEQIGLIIDKEKFSKKNGFSTLSNYFDALEDKIVSRVISKEKETKVISLRQRILKVIPAAIAASIALFISLTYFNTSNTEINFDNLAQSEIETWFLESSSSLTIESIAEFIPIEDLNMNDFSYANIDDEVIEDYIISNENSTFLNEIK